MPATLISTNAPGTKRLRIRVTSLVKGAEGGALEAGHPIRAQTEEAGHLTIAQAEGAGRLTREEAGHLTREEAEEDHHSRGGLLFRVKGLHSKAEDLPPSQAGATLEASLPAPSLEAACLWP
mmetsp:Transcript_11335/g.15434  ORF Transcript_11335/g.15434 Transcript_11335/m.15434 type:complete len:122 (-) Transcript_11335:340-705(-)